MFDLRHAPEEIAMEVGSLVPRGAIEEVSSLAEEPDNLACLWLKLPTATVQILGYRLQGLRDVLRAGEVDFVQALKRGRLARARQGGEPVVHTIQISTRRSSGMCMHAWVHSR
jgi:hypothetical protein